MKKLRVVVLGAGFAGLEIASVLSDKMGGFLDLILIDKSDSFFFGYSKLDVMFGKHLPWEVKFSYSLLNKPGVTFKKEQVVAIDPVKKQVRTEKNLYNADVLVIALGADYDFNLTPGLKEGGNEFYSFEGAERISRILPGIQKGNIIVGVTGFPFKCPQAPSEAALLLHHFLEKKGIRNHINMSLVVPFELPIPPSFGMSKSLLKAFKEKNINYMPEMMVGEIDPSKKLAVLDDGTELPFDLFLGIPEHCVPDVLQESGLLFDEWIPVDPKTLKTSFEGVYALGDVTSVGTPKAGVFAEGAARIAADCIFSEFNGKEFKGAYNGTGTCYLEVGEGKVGRVNVDFFSAKQPKGNHTEPSEVLLFEKKQHEKIRIKRWFGL